MIYEALQRDGLDVVMASSIIEDYRRGDLAALIWVHGFFDFHYKKMEEKKPEISLEPRHLS